MPGGRSAQADMLRTRWLLGPGFLLNFSPVASLGPSVCTHGVCRWELRQPHVTLAVRKRHVGAPCASDTWQDLQKGLAFRAAMVPHYS